MAGTGGDGGKIRVLYVLWTFPQLSQTYIKNEIEALSDACEIDVVALKKANLPYETRQHYRTEPRLGALAEQIRAFKPRVLHTHWLNMAPLMHRLSEKTGVPYTVRGHSFDILGTDEKLSRADALIKWLKGRPNFRGFAPEQVVRHVNAPQCLGVLTFPLARPRLEAAGISPDKIHDCFPVIAFDRFHNPSPNGDGVMNMGACIPKKRMEDFVDLGELVRERPFRLYSIGYQTEKIAAYNEGKGRPIEIVPTVQPDLMPREYKKHQWLVYTASKGYNTVGWPMAVAEAQAAGLGVCVPNLRPDLREYLGESGFLYDSLAEVADIIRQDVPDEMRQRGFEQARKSDIKAHKRLLEGLWDRQRAA